MMRAAVLSSIFALTAGAALAQPPAPPAGGYSLPPESQPSALPSEQSGPPPMGGYGYGPGPGRQGQDPETRALRHKMRAACAADVSTYCAGAGGAPGSYAGGSPSGDMGPPQGDPNGHRALHQCMMANQARFSMPCQQAIADLRAHMHEARMGAGAQPGMGSSSYGPGAMPPQSPQQPPPSR